MLSFMESEQLEGIYTFFKVRFDLQAASFKEQHNVSPISVYNYIASAGLPSLSRALYHGIELDKLLDNNRRIGFDSPEEVFKYVEGHGSGFGLEDQDPGPDIMEIILIGGEGPSWPFCLYGKQIKDTWEYLQCFWDIDRLFILTQGRIRGHIIRASKNGDIEYAVPNVSAYAQRMVRMMRYNGQTKE